MSNEMPKNIAAELRVRAAIEQVKGSLFERAADEIERLHRDYSCICSEMRRMMKERDEERLQTGRILNEIDCRIEHGAESNGHLEAIRNLLTENADAR